MTQDELYNLMVAASKEADTLIADGMPRQQATRIATDALADVVRSRNAEHVAMGLYGLGDTVNIPDAPEVVKEIQQKISPWLWVFSVLGFGMAVMNTRRISKIYGGWRAGKQAVRQGRIPR